MKEKPLVIEKVAALAMELGSRHLADYGATRSRHDFTQRQLMACLILRAYTKTTYRGLIEFLGVSPSVRQELGIGRQAAALYHPAKILGAEPSSGDSRRHDSNYRPIGG
jgi:hypothetical protein